MVKVFYSFISEFDFDKNLIGSIDSVRAEYLSKITDIKRLAQSFYVWVLLEKSLKDFFGIFKNEFFVKNNKWSLKSIKPYFSISHSANLIAISISNEYESGIDCQICTEKILRLKEKLNVEDQNVENLTLEWTKKESFYKFNGEKFVSKTVFDNLDNTFILTVCSNADKVEFEQIDFDLLLNN